ncbi:MAG: T9SS type A sorting domain-containing protein, partial [Bacteroidales bacterium]|nr:T9SS type A sorting domain-containing protein [Bacteroidales bacterium]
SGAKYYITEYGGDGTVFTTMDDATVEVKTDLTWDGSESSNWATSANWVQNVAPNASLNVVIPDVVIDPIIAYNGTASCNNLTVNSGATLTINSTSSGTGSLIVEGTASGNVIFKRYVDEASKAATWHYVSSPVAGQALNDSWMTSNSIVNTPPYQFFRWDEDTDYWIIYGSTGNPEAFTDNTFVGARGYCLTRDGAGELSFTGTVRTSDVTYAATYTTGKGEGFNLVGNPFTSSLMATTTASATLNFLTVNTALLDDSFEALYIWDEQTGYTGNRNDYKVISNSGIFGYTSIDQHYISSGQAFMVKVVSVGGNLAFNTNMQVHNNATYYKNNNDVWPSVELIVENNDLYNSTAIGFNENMTPGLDPSYDVGKMKGNPDIALYTKLVEDNGVDFAIQALPPISNQEVEIKIGLDVSQAGDYNFKLTDSENFDETISIKLEDKETGELIDFREIEEYSFNISQAGEIRERFVLHFNNATGIEDQIPETENIRFYVYDNKLYIIDEELKNGTIQLYNLIGQPVMEKRYSGRVITIDLDLPTGYYFVRIITEKKSISGKIYIE